MPTFYVSCSITYDPQTTQEIWNVNIGKIISPYYIENDITTIMDTKDGQSYQHKDGFCVAQNEGNQIILSQITTVVTDTECDAYDLCAYSFIFNLGKLTLTDLTYTTTSKQVDFGEMLFWSHLQHWVESLTPQKIYKGFKKIEVQVLEI